MRHQTRWRDGVRATGSSGAIGSARARRPGEAVGLRAPCVRTCFSGWGRLGEYAADETSIRFPPKTIYRSRVETEQDFYAGARWHVLNPFHGDWKIARRRLLLDQAVLTAKNLCIFL